MLYIRDHNDGTLKPIAITDTGSLKVGSGAKVVSASFTRPNDTTAYAAGDTVSTSTSAPTVITFTDVTPENNGTGVITRAQLVDSANQTTAGSFELWLFDTTFSPHNDNALFTPTDTECRTLVAIIPFTTNYVGDATSGAGGNRVYTATNLNIPFQTGTTSKNLFGELVVRNAYTPTANEVFHIRLGMLLD